MLLKILSKILLKEKVLTKLKKKKKTASTNWLRYSSISYFVFRFRDSNSIVTKDCYVTVLRQNQMGKRRKKSWGRKQIMSTRIPRQVNVTLRKHVLKSNTTHRHRKNKNYNFFF